MGGGRIKNAGSPCAKSSEYGSVCLSEIQNALGLAFEVFQVIGTGAGVRAAFFKCDFLTLMRANCFSFGA